MPVAYRIFKTKHSAAWFSGEGSFRFGGRWNSRGTRLLYTAESLSLAVLEMMVNLNNDELLASYSFAVLEFEQHLAISAADIYKLPKNWDHSPPPLAIQRIGDKWAASNVSAVLKVPTAVVPGESNYLINVRHKDFAKIKLGEPQKFVFDQRLYKR